MRVPMPVEDHVFANGVRIHRSHLQPEQLDRYRTHNLHEPVEEAWFLARIRELTPEEVFVDAGAAVGYYCILSRRLAPRVSEHAFEPLALHRECLRENLRLNAIALACAS